MKKTGLSIFILLQAFLCEAHHIIGGEMTYLYLGKGTAVNTSRYQITLKIFRDQNASGNTAPMPTEVYIGIFNNDNGTQYQHPNSNVPYYIVQRSQENEVTVNPFPHCITRAPNLNYHVGYFILTVDLPDNEQGYTATFQTCCRIDNLSNVENLGGSETGSTFSCTIPAAKYQDNSPEFATSIDVICAGKPFQLDFSAKDKDNDSLVYSFAPAYNGGAFINAQNGNPAPPPYSSVSYFSPYGARFPLGPSVTIDSETGMISGIAPDVGKYVVCVKVLSYRNGILLNDHRKDFIINITNCEFAGAQLNPQPAACDSFNILFKNDNNSSLNKTYYWDFGDPASGASNFSTLETPYHTFSDTGVYVYKLVVNRGDPCSDSTTQTIKVYPGVKPSFTSFGQCINAPIRFTDQSTTVYEPVSSWKWDFGVPAADTDISDQKNPTYTYAEPASYPVSLTITTPKGCEKTFTDTILIKLRPDLKLSNDTLICTIDTLQLNAAGAGTITWSPAYNINNVHSFSPLVSPDAPTTYFATLVESPGCVNTDSVKVNVVNKVSLSLKADTTICLSDTAVIYPVSDALHYVWTPSSTILNDTAKYAVAVPEATTRYHVVASIGKCNTPGDILIKTVPYPDANAGRDTAICFPNSYQLHATGGSIYTWSPPSFLNDPGVASPVATPPESIMYIVEVKDILGCSKPTYDSIIITVEKPVADAGPRDTAIVINQPLQLHGSGASIYSWSPAAGLSNSAIADPVAILNDSRQYVLKVSTLNGCTATDTINITVYKVLPDFYVPNAFTPNQDGKNDIFMPIPIGMRSFNYFRVYNRLGQLIFSTNIQNKGWDGTLKGIPQDPDVFVWMAEGVDYLGKTIFKKGTVVLIR